VGSFSTVGHAQLSSGIASSGVFSYTDGSSNNHAYTINGTAVSKASYSPPLIDQTTYLLTRSISSIDLSNKAAITFNVYSSRTGSYTAFEIYNGSGWQQCGNNSDFSSGVFVINSANTWETKTCDTNAISPRSAVTQLRFRVTSSSTTAWTAYLDDIMARLTYFTGTTPDASNGLATLGAANLTLNA